MRHDTQPRPHHRAAARLAAAAAMGFAISALGSTVPPHPAVALIDVERANQPQVLVPQRALRPSLSVEAVRVSSVQATVDIADRIATTTLRLEFTNPSSTMAETVILLPVPEGVSIRAFSLGDGELQGEVLPRDEARRTYTEIVRRMIDPGLLEFVGTSAVRSSVFPVPPQGTQVATLTYTQVLDGHGSRVDYVLPRTQDPAAVTADWSIDVNVSTPGTDTGRALAAWSPSHAIITEPNDDGVRVRVPDVSAAGPFRLSVLMPSEDPITAIHFPDPDDPAIGGHVALFLAAPEPDAQADPIPREVTVVIDRSGSMRGEKLEQAKAAALQVIEALGPDERFSVIDYADDVRRFRPEAVARTPEHIDAVRAYIEGIQAVGGTNIHDALTSAVAPEPAEGTLPIVLFLTDGLATKGVTDEAAIRDGVTTANAHDRRIFTFGVGADLNAALLSTLADATRAEPTYVRPGESTEVKVGELFAKLAGPMVTELHLEHAGRLTEVIPGSDSLPDLFVGGTQVVLARYTGTEPFDAVITGRARGGEPVLFTASIDPGRAVSATATAVPRLWAQRRIADLVTQIREAGADGPVAPDDPRVQELVSDIVYLSQRFGILTEYTAFLAAEREELALVPELNELDFDDPGSLGLDDVAGRMLSGRAAGGRVGAGAVAQSEALARQRRGVAAQSMGDQLDSASQMFAFGVPAEAARENASRVVSRIQQAGDQALFQRRGRWVDARLLGDTLNEANDIEPDETVQFGSDRYDDVLTQLVAQGRQSLIAVPGEVEILLEGRRVLVQNPG